MVKVVIANITLVALCLITVVTHVEAATYREFKVPGSKFTEASGINNHSEIVGSYSTSTATHAFLLKGGRYSSFDFPGANYTGAFGINDDGAIVGGFGDVQHNYHGFLRKDGAYTQLDFPGSIGTTVWGINNRGVIVGSYMNSNHGGHGFILENGIWTSVDLLNAVDTDVYGVNDSGDISGTYFDSSYFSYGFILRHDGTVIIVNYPGRRGYTLVMGINNLGEIVGQYGSPKRYGKTGGFLSSNGTFTKIQAPRFSDTQPWAINDRHYVIGFGNISRRTGMSFYVKLH